MPATCSDVHEASVLFWFRNQNKPAYSIKERYVLFSTFASEISQTKIQISKDDFDTYTDTFLRAQSLAIQLKENLKLKGSSIKWVGMEDHKIDSADIIIDDKKISLKDDSKIVRNNGFEQLLKTYCKTSVKVFKDPFLEFSPKLSSKYLRIVIKANFKLEILAIKDKFIYLNDRKISAFSGSAKDFETFTLVEIAKLFKPKDLKEMVKFFSSSNFHDELFDVRKEIVEDVSHKVVAVLNEGWLQDKSHVENEFKKLLQYTSELKYFGYSSSKFNHVGVIVTDKMVKLNLKSISTVASKLKPEATGLQINLYTDLEVVIDGQKKKLVMVENQLRYKHRTFSCAPEANTHLTSAESWKDIYPLIEKLI